MSKRILVISILAIASFFVACSQGDEATPDMTQQQAAAPKSVPIVTVDQFTAPSSPVITEDQAKRYAKASAALVELGVKWSEKIDNAADGEKVQILNAYNVARDQLCARVGLAGIAEYNWITTVALPEAKNKAVFEAAGVKTAN
jgi:hypothetical protein